jgi:hypothetical protein
VERFILVKTVERNKTLFVTCPQTSLANNALICYNGKGRTGCPNVDNRWISKGQVGAKLAVVLAFDLLSAGPLVGGGFVAANTLFLGSFFAYHILCGKSAYLVNNSSYRELVDNYVINSALCCE